MQQVAIASLHVYPLKGAAGFAPRRWEIDPRGLRHDRRFMVVRPDGSFVTQRQEPRLALLEAAIEGERLDLRSACGSASVAAVPDGGRRLPVRVWDDEVDALLPSSHADQLLEAHLGFPACLAYMPETSGRRTAPKRGEPTSPVSFADAAPILLAAESALAELGERLEAAGAEPVPMDRFRPNIVVRGNARGDDDRWAAVAIGAARLRVATPCKRCQVVTIDQRTAELRGPEPLRTLATYRRLEDAVVFGRHVLVDRGGPIAVGDRVEVLAT